MSTLLVNNVKSFTGDTVTISGSNILVQGNTTLGDNINDTIVVRGHVTASGNISASGTIFADSFQSSTGGATLDFSDDVDITGSLNVTQDIDARNISASGQLSASGITATTAVLAQPNDFGFFGVYAALSSSGLITGSDLSLGGDLTATNATAQFANITASGQLSASNLTATSTVFAQPSDFGFFGVYAALSSSGLITGSDLSVSGDIFAGRFITQGTSIHNGGTGVNLRHGNVSASGALTASSLNINATGQPHNFINDRLHVGGTTTPTKTLVVSGDASITGNTFVGPLTASGDISASNLTLSGDLTATNATAQFANITASGDIICLNISSSNVRTHGVEVVPVQNNSSVDQVNMSQNGRKVIVKNQLQAQLNDGAFAEFRLLNTSIATDSIVLGSFIGNTAGVITGSIITAATTATSTASIQIHNETGGNIANDTAFTASFIVL